MREYIHKVWGRDRLGEAAMAVRLGGWMGVAVSLRCEIGSSLYQVILHCSTGTSCAQCTPPQRFHHGTPPPLGASSRGTLNTGPPHSEHLNPTILRHSEFSVRQTRRMFVVGFQRNRITAKQSPALWSRIDSFDSRAAMITMCNGGLRTAARTHRVRLPRPRDADDSACLD